MVGIPTNRIPTYPGEMLLEEFLKPIGITQKQLIRPLQVPFQRINKFVTGKRGITPGAALRFSRFFGNIPDFRIASVDRKLYKYH